MQRDTFSILGLKELDISNPKSTANPSHSSSQINNLMNPLMEEKVEQSQVSLSVWLLMCQTVIKHIYTSQYIELRHTHL